MNSDESVQLLDYLRAIRRRWRLIALIVAVTTGVALLVSLASEKKYDATAELLLRSQEPVNSLLDLNGGGGASDPERELNTDVELVKAAAIARAVRRDLDLQRSDDDLLEQVETEKASTSNIVKLRVRDEDPVVAARIANAFATEYVRFRLESARRRYAEAADLALKQLLELTPAERRRTVRGRELQSRQSELLIAAALQTGGAEIVRRASVPASPSRPRPKLSAALGLLLGSVIGLAAALILDLTDRRFKDERSVESFFEAPILATIPTTSRREQLADDPAQREAYGLLAANLPFAAGRGPCPVLMITSPSPGEGKTSVTIGAARALARFGSRVIVVEADLRRPTFGRYADISGSSGLTGALRGDPLSDTLVWVDAGTLQTASEANAEGTVGLLPAGNLPANTQRTLSEGSMDSLMSSLRAMADIVLIDTAPVGTVNDAAMLAWVIDGIALVVRVNQTTKDAGRRASRALRNLDVKILGVVVTDVGHHERNAYYYDQPATSLPRDGLGGVAPRAGT